MTVRAFIATAFVALALPTAIGASFPGANGKIVFASDRDGNVEIYSAEPDGSGQTRLTVTPTWGANQAPAWSPDGSLIAFISSIEGSSWALTVMNADGSEQRALFPTEDQVYDDWSPAWSPDGSRIAFGSTRPFNGSWQVWVVSPDGSGLRQLTTTWGHSPAWSPDGTKIAYVGRDPDVGNVVYVMNADGSDARRLTTGTHPEVAPSWSPDGTKIAFGRYTADWRTSSEHVIFVVHADGTGEQQLTGGDVFDSRPVWSPDGTKILFQRRVALGSPQLFVMNADGTGETEFITGPGSNYQPDWAAAPAPPDETPPTITIATPPEGAVYTLGEQVAPVYSCTDEPGGSGLESCALKPALAGDALDTSSVGWKSLTVVAFDRAGNSSALSRSYWVVYPFAGFFSPVDNPPEINSANAGESVPLRFSLGGDRGLGILSGARMYPTTCEAAEPLLGTAAEGELVYNAKHDRYTFEWETEKAWAESCRLFVLVLDDGSEHWASFKFAK